MAAQIPARMKARVREQGMNARLLLGIIEHELGFPIFARDRKIGFYDHCSRGVMFAKVFPPQQQKIAQVSHTCNKQQAKQRP